MNVKDLKPVGLFATYETREQLDAALESLGAEGVMGAMFMYNYIANQLNKKED